MQWAAATLTTDQSYLAARDDSPALQATSLVIERMPMPELVESAQGVQLIGSVIRHIAEILFTGRKRVNRTSAASRSS